MDNDNGMRIFIFQSGTSDGLHAFADDRDGLKLPAQFRPWTAIGVVAPDRSPPYNMPRDVIEAAIGREGFQLWRKKRKVDSPQFG